MHEKHIRPVAVCLFRKGERILVSEGYDSSNQSRFCRPLGGEIEFGESSHDALLREMLEETGAGVEDLALVGVLENIFSYEGEQRHEIVFVYDARFTDRSLYQRDEIPGYREEVGDEFTARWLSLAEMEKNNVRLVPEGLTALISK